MASGSEMSNSEVSKTTFQPPRKFSDNSLYNFATQFLRETDPNQDLSHSDNAVSQQLTLDLTGDANENGPGESSSALQYGGNSTRNPSENIAGPSQGHNEREESSGSPGPGETGDDQHTVRVPIESASSADFGGSVGVLPINDDNESESNSDDAGGANPNGREVALVEPIAEFQLERSQFDKPSGYLECQLEVMYFLGVSSYRRLEFKPLHPSIRITQNIVYWIFSILTTFQMLCLLKNETVHAAGTKQLKYCVEFGYAAVRLIDRCMFVYLISCVGEKISVMLLHFLKRTAFMVIASFLVTFITVFCGYDALADWDIGDAIQIRAFHLSRSVFIWNSTSYDETNNKLFDEYFLKDITLTHVFMGIIEGTLDFCATLQGDMIRDFVLIAALVISSGWIFFEKRIESQILMHPNNTDATEVEASLQHYKALRLATKLINEALRIVLNFLIVENLLLYGYLFVQWLTLTHFTMRIVYYTILAVKATITFYIAMRIYWRNGNVSTWLRLMSSYEGPVDVVKILGMTIQAALDDIRDNPIGFGQDYFLINESFLVGFFAAVASIISFLVQFENAMCDSKQSA